MIFFNFLHCPDGGGYQNSLSFMRVLVDRSYDFTDVICVVYVDSELEELCFQNNISVQSTEYGFLSKTILEIKVSLTLRSGDLVFSIFGPPLIYTPKKCVSVGGMAVSNLLHKDVDFWGYLGWREKMKKILKDRYRAYRYSKLDYWIFETNLLREKAVQLFGVPEERSTVVEMSPSLLVSPNAVKDCKLALRVREINSEYKFLFLSGAHPNKRLHVLPDLARNLLDLGVNFSFVLTSENNGYLEEVLDTASLLGVSDRFVNIGKVPPSAVASVIDSCDFMCTFSLLESFSNNFVEAWVMKVPLLVTNAEWAQRACGKAAYYVDPESGVELAQSINNLLGQTSVVNGLVFAGEEALIEHPTGNEKTDKYLCAIEMAKTIGEIGSFEKKGVKF